MAFIPELVKRLRLAFERRGWRFDVPAGASHETIAAAEREFGFAFPRELKELWLIMNGAGDIPIFLDEWRHFGFDSIDTALERRFTRDAKWFELWSGDPPEGDREPGIQADFMEHTHWIKLSRFPGGSAELYCDCAPRDDGTYGQLITYSHDPEAIYFVSTGVQAFLEEIVQYQETADSDELDEWYEHFGVTRLCP